MVPAVPSWWIMDSHFMRNYMIADTMPGSTFLTGSTSDARATRFSAYWSHTMPEPLKMVYEKDALLHEATLANTNEEWRMRVRVILRSFYALYDMKALLNPFRFFLVSFQVATHKVLRYLVGILQLSALGFNLALASTSSFFLKTSLG
jgi:hypothetical protein